MTRKKLVSVGSGLGRLPRAAAVVVVLVLVAIAGCNREVRVPVHPVTGKVTFAGEVPVGAQVVLHPQGQTGQSFPPNVAASGTVQKDGTFKISVYEAGDGAPVGDYVLTIEWYKVITSPDGGGGAGPNVLPKQYSRADQSPVKISVKEGSNEIPPIEIARR